MTTGVTKNNTLQLRGQRGQKLTLVEATGGCVHRAAAEASFSFARNAKIGITQRAIVTISMRAPAAEFAIHMLIE